MGLNSMILVLLLTIPGRSFAQPDPTTSGNNNRDRNIFDPVSNFFSELGHLFLDVDRAFEQQTAPMVAFENRWAQQKYRSPRAEYIERTQQNYRDLQARIGSSVSRLPEDVTSNLLGVNIQSKGSRTFVDVSMPSVKLSLDTNLSPPTGRITESASTPDALSLLARSNVEGKFSIGEEVTRRASDLPDDRLLDTATNPVNEGRILGDVLYSESRFDRYMRHFVERHAKWFLDPSLPSILGNRRNPKDVLQQPLREDVVDRSGEMENVRTSDVKNEAEGDRHAANQHIPSSPDAYNDPQTDISIDNNRQTDNSNPPAKETVILAFTHDGVPLKLRMGSEIENPVKFLHRALSGAGVSLNVPVLSYEDVEPAGEEILQLGAGSGGVITRALYVDLSDSDQLRSLLRSLKRSKNH